MFVAQRLAALALGCELGAELALGRSVSLTLQLEVVAHRLSDRVGFDDSALEVAHLGEPALGLGGALGGVAVCLSLALGPFEIGPDGVALVAGRFEFLANLGEIGAGRCQRGLRAVEVDTRVVELRPRRVLLGAGGLKVGARRVQLLTYRVGLVTRRVELLPRRVELLSRRVELLPRRVPVGGEGLAVNASGVELGAERIKINS